MSHINEAWYEDEAGMYPDYSTWNKYDYFKKDVVRKITNMLDANDKKFAQSTSKRIRHLNYLVDEYLIPRLEDILIYE